MIQDQARVYKLSLKWKASLVLSSLLLSAIFGGLAAIPFLGGRAGNVFFIVFISLLVLSQLSIFRSRLEIDEDRICKVGVFGRSEIRVNDVKGFRKQSSDSVTLFSKSGSGKIRILLRYEHTPEFMAWLQQTLTNLDAVDFAEEMKRLESDPSLGNTPDQRWSLVGKARKWAFFLNTLGIVIQLWVSFYPQPYREAVLICIVFPLVALFPLRFFRGVLKFDTKRNSPYPGIAFAYLIPILGLGMLRPFDWNIISWNPFWPAFWTATTIVLILSVMLLGTERKSMSALVLVLVLSAVHGASSVVVLNCILDDSAASVSTSRILSKRADSGRRRSYYFAVSAGREGGATEVRVDKAVFDQHKIGDEVRVSTRNGKFGIPWYVVQ